LIIALIRTSVFISSTGIPDFEVLRSNSHLWFLFISAVKIVILYPKTFPSAFCYLVWFVKIDFVVWNSSWLGASVCVAKIT